MPELPEVETIKSGLVQTVKDKKIIKVEIRLSKIIKGTSVESFIDRVTGATIKNIERRAKNLIITLSNNFGMVIHLKLTGQLIYSKPNTLKDKHTHVIFIFEDKSELHYNDLRRFGYIMLVETDQLGQVKELADLGPEPLNENFTLNYFKDLLKKKKRGKIKPILMDQKFIAGIGNLYADEILFYAKIHPLRDVSTLSENEISRIYDGIKEILPAAIKHRGSSVDNYVDVDGKKGGYVPFIKVYGREGKPCPKCKTPIERIKIGQRSAHFCPKCQIIV
ncbi:MAG: DNA-formamidopyrimidine glycosylase [Actinobacteria bacterium]|nr:DNA-formamidopyrimidine glycosylase [Actinomycetota bacterium]